MKKMVQEFSSNQNMNNSTVELFHYQDVRFGKVHPHVHTHYEFYFFLDGQTKYFIENHQYNMEKGDILMIPPDLLHFPEVFISDSSKPYERFVIWVNTDYYKQLTKFDSSLLHMLKLITQNHNWHFRPNAEDFPKVRELLFAMLEEKVTQELSFQASIEGYFLQLLVLLNRMTQHKSSFQHYYPSKDMYSAIINYIHVNIRKNMSIENITKEFFISKSYLSKIFRQHLGISFHQYILRVKTDKILLEVNNGKTFSDASYEYGFLSYSSFYRQCMREYNTSPKNLKTIYQEK